VSVNRGRSVSDSILVRPAETPYASLFPADVVVVAGNPDGASCALFPEEAAQVAKAVPKRKQEYAAARGLARRALTSLGFEPLPIVNDADRVPAFPEGTVGGITHTRGLCIVAAAPASRYRALGVDAEGAAPLEEKLFDTVLRPEELARLGGLDVALRGRFAKLVFCIKECAYKAQYPLSRKYFGFSGMSVEAEGGRFVATMEIDAGPFVRGHRFEGRYAVDDAYVVSAVAIPR
jgi:4'-phosphopantetheinyl transferase EntD